MRCLLLILLFTRLLLQSSIANEEVTVIIDPGHGGTNSSGSHLTKCNSSPNNAISPRGLKEKDLTLELSKEIQSALESEPITKGIPSIRCVLTRTNDWNPDFSQRANVAAESTNPAALVSIHFNTFPHGGVLGTVALIHNKEHNPNHDADLRFADGLTAATSAAVRTFVPGSPAMDSINDLHLHDGDGAYLFYQMSRHPQLCSVPKCFLEVEFIDRLDVQKKLLDHRSETFPLIAKSIADYLTDYIRQHPLQK